MQHDAEQPKKASSTPASHVGWGSTETPTPSGWARGPAQTLRTTQDVNVSQVRSLSSPRQVKRELPMTLPANQTVVESRDQLKAILAGHDPRMLVITGPCSIHDERAAVEYAERLRALQSETSDHLFIVMRVYFEKPRTTVGWKGLINDPHLDDTFDMEEGLRRARRLLLTISELGVAAGTEMLEPITPQYIADLVTWSAIGARTTESQTHRQLSSGLSMPVGFKNGTDGGLGIALDAMEAASNPQAFLGIDEDGRTSVIETRGNAWGHLILRGGRDGPNYDSESVAEAASAMRHRKHLPRVVVDCSHANSNKQAKNQLHVWESVMQQYRAGQAGLVGTMLESHLNFGKQKLNGDPHNLEFGVSITDECLGWDDTASLLRDACTQIARTDA